MSKIFRIIFAGTTDFSKQHLELLIENDFNIVSVITKPDPLFLKNKRLLFNPVKKLALKKNIILLQPKLLSSYSFILRLKKIDPDLIIVVAYGFIFPDELLFLPKFGCINIHGSLLPRWRGPAPIQRSILNGDKKTGITIIKMNSKIDSGNILSQECCNISSDETSISLYEKLLKISKISLLKVLSKIQYNLKIFYIKQNNNLSTYAKKISYEEARINWNNSAIYIDRCIRAFNMWPVCYFFVFGKKIKVLKSLVKKNSVLIKPGIVLKIDKIGIHVSTGKDIIILTELKPENKKKMSSIDFVNSRYKWFFKGILLE